MSADEDERDVDRVLGGDISAFEGIVRRWQGPLVNLAYRFCRDGGRAEEMAQEAFLRAFRSLAGWRRNSTFSTWLFAISTNLYRTELRRIPRATMSLDETAKIADSRSSPAVLEEAARDRAVRRAVDALPEKYRDTLILFYFHDQGVTATARSLGLAEGTVKARLFRARAMLRGELASLAAVPPPRAST